VARWKSAATIASVALAIIVIAPYDEEAECDETAKTMTITNDAQLTLVVVPTGFHVNAQM